MIFPANILESMVYSMDVTGMQVLGALFTALVVCAALGPVMIPALHKLKFGQSIRDVGPASHMKKSGTPTMGGIMMLCGLFIAMLVWNRFTPLIIIAFVLTFGHALIGFLDDYIKVVMKRNLGLTAKQKLALQIALAMGNGVYLLCGAACGSVRNGFMDSGNRCYDSYGLALLRTCAVASGGNHECGKSD